MNDTTTRPSDAADRHKDATIHDLLITCLKDLGDGERQVAKRLDAIAGSAADTRLRDIVRAIARRAGAYQADLCEAARQISGEQPTASNIWMAGILDDAEGDTETIEHGRLLDIAMIGAVRKALAAAIVSYETAIAVARSCERAAVAMIADRIRREKQEADALLGDLLESLAGAPVDGADQSM